MRRSIQKDIDTLPQICHECCWTFAFTAFGLIFFAFVAFAIVVIAFVAFAFVAFAFGVFTFVSSRHASAESRLVQRCLECFWAICPQTVGWKT